MTTTTTTASSLTTAPTYSYKELIRTLSKRLRRRITKSTLSRWMALALIPPNPTGKPRKYSERDVLKIWFIARAIERNRNASLAQERLIDFLENYPCL